jgi:hypothetical protein
MVSFQYSPKFRFFLSVPRTLNSYVDFDDAAFHSGMHAKVAEIVNPYGLVRVVTTRRTLRNSKEENMTSSTSILEFLILSKLELYRYGRLLV